MKQATPLPTSARPTPPAMQQHPNYIKTVRALGGEADVLDLRVQNREIGSIQRVKRQFGPVSASWLARGPCWRAGATHDEKQAALTDLQEKIGGLCLALPAGDADTELFKRLGYRSLITPQHLAVLDLTADPDTRLAAQHGKWRNRLRQAQNAKIRVTRAAFSPKRHGDLLLREAAQRRSKGYRALPLSFTRAWAMANPGQVQVFQAGDDAFMILLLHAPAASYHIGWSNAAGRQISAHNLLLWEAANWLAVNGITRLELGLIDTEVTAGLARFKLGAGARVERLGPTMLRTRPRWLRRIYRAA